jgi:hypothetical protein
MDREARIERGKRKKAKIAAELTSVEMIVACLSWLINNCVHGGWTPMKTVDSQRNLLNGVWKKHFWAASRMLKLKPSAPKGGYFMRAKPGIELEKFGLNHVDWSRLNADLSIDASIVIFSQSHKALIARVKSFLLGEQIDPLFGCFAPYEPPTMTERLAAKPKTLYPLNLHEKMLDSKLGHNFLDTFLK